MFVLSFSICVSSLFCTLKIKAMKDENRYLMGRTIFIDAGHGGKDNGASVDGVMEDNINMKISGYLVELLVDAGAYVLMSRTSDYDLASLYQKNRKREDLNRRVRYINNSEPDIFLSIHLNTYPSDGVRGAQVFYQNNDNSKNLANIIQNKLNVLTSKERKTKLGDYFILNKTRVTGVLIECGFLSNEEERNQLNKEEYQKKIANKIKQGIVEYFYKDNH